jgi:hypothetical protein
MVGNNTQLVSPPALDWIQVIALVLVAVNLWFAWDFLRARQASRLHPTGQPVNDLVQLQQMSWGSSMTCSQATTKLEEV